MKVQIIGGSGTGKSTLAKYISEKEDIKWIDTDNYLWKDDSFLENNPIEKRVEMYQRDMFSNDSYIASGSVFMWCPEGFNNRHLLVFLSLDEEVRMQRLRNREIERNSQIWLDENGEYTNDFLEWCKTYWSEEDKKMAGTYGEQSYQMTISKSPVLKLNGSQPLDELYAEIRRTVSKENC
ncbi:AAA family ATPase [Fictibacillus sp. 5RED26]|jgi:adenylate kinase family enzyme|uniref:AAA family ATPase n=1 Tax=unclassified Fictibacillus TaxID=2644029 RepID=UPI0018CE1AA8|nr:MULTISPECIES: AAA family ATPase [unclassified Fictibacillus]MBH0156156.1 AAA family ATPase [Fictibacillus sp. 5RED26]MBH0165622.1 AAA family ATPase [Fictibacillus sp. 7GRE50]